MSDNVIHALAGAGGGILSMLVTYPLITISTKAQVKKADGKKSLGWHSQWETAKHIVDERGVRGLYAGIDSAVFGNAVTNGFYYYFYEATKKLMMGDGHLSTAESLVCGLIAGSATATCSNPIWTVMTRKIANVNKSTREVVSQIWQLDGPGGFFRGLVPALILVSNPIIQYTVFEQMRQRVARANPGSGTASGAGGGGADAKVLTAWDFFWLGAVSKLVATTLTYPYITLKSKMQVSKGSEKMTQVAKQMLSEGGIGSFYSGIESKLLQSVLTAAILFATKEMLYNYTVRILALLGGSHVPTKTEL